LLSLPFVLSSFSFFFSIGFCTILSNKNYRKKNILSSKLLKRIVRI
jgi:hypothetical protein